MNSRTKLLALLALLALLISGISGVSAQNESPLASPTAPTSYTLQVLHSSDNESSFLDPNTLEPKILHYGAIVAGLRQLEADGTIHVTAGDHVLPNPFYQASAEVESLGAPGIGDIVIYNGLGETANGIGNHEFDGGINDFARMLNEAAYPFLAVNLDFSAVELAEGVPAIEIGEDGASVAENAGKVAKSAYVEVGGERIGLIGRAPADFFNVIADPEETMPGLDFVGGRNPENNQPLESAVPQVLEQVELLEAQGINKIILLDHAQDFTSDPLSARDLRGIDIIVAAGSTGFMGNPTVDGPFNLLRAGDEAQASYPTLRLNSAGNLVLVVNSDQLYTYVGHLLVTFDGEGRIVNVDPRSGPIATTEEAVTALENVVGTELTAPADVQATFNALTSTQLIQEQFEVVGSTEHVLNGARADVRSQETNLGRLAADSTLWYAQNEFPDMDIDVALKNGGGIRATIEGPNITRFGVGTALAFDNRLSIVELTGDQLLATMENAVSRVPALDGRFPQIAGMTLAYDASNEGISDQTSLEEPSRVQSLVIRRADGTEDALVEDGAVQGDLSRTFTVATNSFLLTGGDGYNALAAAAEEVGAAETELGERQILIDYIQTGLGGQVSIPSPPDDPRVVRLDVEEESTE